MRSIAQSCWLFGWSYCNVPSSRRASSVSASRNTAGFDVKSIHHADVLFLFHYMCEHLRLRSSTSRNNRTVRVFPELTYQFSRARKELVSLTVPLRSIAPCPFPIQTIDRFPRSSIWKPHRFAIQCVGTKA